MLSVDGALSALLSWGDEHRAGLSIVLVREGRLRRFELYEYPGC